MQNYEQIMISQLSSNKQQVMIVRYNYTTQFLFYIFISHSLKYIRIEKFLFLFCTK